MAERNGYSKQNLPSDIRQAREILFPGLEPTREQYVETIQELRIQALQRKSRG